MENKEKLIQWLQQLPDDIQVYKTEVNAYDCIDIKIFIKTKDEKFLEWYFGP